MTDGKPSGRTVELAKAILDPESKCDTVEETIKYAALAIDAHVAALLAEREAELAEALKYGAPVAGAVALSFVKDPCKRHNHYWTTISGACMACRAEDAEKRVKALGAEVEAWRVWKHATVHDPGCADGEACQACNAERDLEEARAAVDALNLKEPRA